MKVEFFTIISACIMWYYGMDNQDRANREAKDIALIESWQKQDTVISFAKLSLMDAPRHEKK